MTLIPRFALVLLAALATLPASVQAIEPAVAAGELRLRHISVVRIGSGGRPVVLIPGLSSPRAVWQDFAPSLAEGRSVYLVQVNGFAGDDPGGNLDGPLLEGIVADLHRFLAGERTGPVRVAGHSLGGLVGLLLASAHPEDVERLMIVDALPFFSVLFAQGSEEPTAATAEPIARMMRDRVAAMHGRPVDPAAVEASIRGLALRPASIRRVRDLAMAADPRVTAQLLYEDMTTDFRPRLAALTAPITVVVPWSESGFGREPTLAFYRRQYAAARAVTFEPIAEAGHFVMFDQPDEFRAALDRFLALPPRDEPSD